MALVRLDVTTAPFQKGRPFGEVGPYEILTGTAQFAIRPEHPLNAVIVDLDLAPRNADGCVECSADVQILRPVDLTRGNRGLFVDVPNRGTSIFARHLEPGPTGPTTDVTEGFLLSRGYTVVTCGWQHDVPRGNGRFGLSAPEAVRDGQPISGEVTTPRTFDAPTDTLVMDSPYLPLDPSGGRLVERDAPTAAAREVPRDRWSFVPGRAAILYTDGFVPGKTYEITYVAVGAPLTGIGMLALRDIAASLRDRFAIALGGSQTGRLLRQLVYLGLCESEDGRIAVDGVLALAAGARMSEANLRFGQPSGQGPQPALFPYTDAVQTDSAAGYRDGLLKRAIERDRVPEVFHLNTSSEYCSSSAIVHTSAALAHLTADQHADVDVPDNVRIYLFASTQHAPSPLPLDPPARGIHAPNTIDYKPFVRAAVDNLAAWITDGVPPPPSRYPRLDDGTLTPDLRSSVDADGNEVAGIRHPDVSVPLGTYTGWNPRHPSTGSPDQLVRAIGASLPFAPDAIVDRYANRDNFLDQIRRSAETLAAERYMLADDVAGVVRDSAERWDEFTHAHDLASQ